MSVLYYLTSACACNTLGTVGNFGCDKETGQCYCKRYVIGANCDHCYVSSTIT